MQKILFCVKKIVGCNLGGSVTNGNDYVLSPTPFFR